MAKKISAGAITVGDKGRVTLSAEVLRQLGVSEGDVLVPELTDHGTLELVPVALIPRDQVWFAHPDMQARIAEAHADVAAKRTTAVQSAADLDAYFAAAKAKGKAD